MCLRRWFVRLHFTRLFCHTNIKNIKSEPNEKKTETEFRTADFHENRHKRIYKTCLHTVMISLY